MSEPKVATFSLFGREYNIPRGFTVAQLEDIEKSIQAPATPIKRATLIIKAGLMRDYQDFSFGDNPTDAKELNNAVMVILSHAGFQS